MCIMIGVVCHIRSHSNSKEIQTASGKIMDVSKLATDFAQKTAEQESKFKNLGEVITQLSPQAEDLLNAKQMQTEKLTRDVEIANK
jgi:hypothetical protein